MTRPGCIKMQCVMLLYACKNNMKPLKHFIVVLPMFNTRRNRRIHIGYKSWTQHRRYVVKVQSHESSRQTDTCHCHTTNRRMPERTSSNASTFSADRRDRISVTVRPTDEKTFHFSLSHARIGPSHVHLSRCTWPSSQTHTKNAWR